MKITKITYNWHQTGDGEQWSYDEEFYTKEVGKGGVVRIHEWSPDFEGDKLRYIVTHESGEELTIFSPNTVLKTK